MAIGPVQFLAFTFREFQPDQGILEALWRAVDSGAIRLIDVQFIRKDQDGTIATMEMSGLSSAEEAELGSVIQGLLDAGAASRGGAVEGSLSASLAAVGDSYGMGLGDIQAVADRIVPGSAAGLAVIEHTWAIEFGEAISQAGGQLAAQGFLTRQAVMKVGEEIEAMAEAEWAIELSEVIQAEAAYDAAEAVELSEAIQDEAARQAVEALVAARLLEKAALEEAARVVTAALAIQAAGSEE
ncbi:MAG: hypothetical protein ACK2UA_12695 [Anaerolineae bacterium]|jgi:hypothetical protein